MNGIVSSVLRRVDSYVVKLYLLQDIIPNGEENIHQTVNQSTPNKLYSNMSNLPELPSPTTPSKAKSR